MNTKIKLLLSASLALVACGDNKSRPDAAQRKDGAGPDAYCSNCPAAPVIGSTQIDRMGRPAINTALIGAFTDPNDMPDAKKDMYNADSAKTNWVGAFKTEMAKNLGVIDVLDGGICGNGICEVDTVAETNATCPADCPTAAQVGTAAPGCGNQVAYSNAGTDNATAYGQLATLLADDRLYVDVEKTTCAFYLAVEFGVVTAVGGVRTNTTCGGRAPAYDVIDFSYSAIAMGLKGFSAPPAFQPQFGDMVGPHTDLLTSFPYLGAPH